MKPLVLVLFLSVSTALAQGGKAPPIPHPIDGYLVTRQENNCLECHDTPRDIGKKRAKGAAVPSPASHYGGNVDGKPAIVDAYYRCTGCHARR